MRYRFTAEQNIPYPLETAFAFFADPANLPRLMPSWQDARIDTATFVAPPSPSHAFPGSDRKNDSKPDDCPARRQEKQGGQ